jgi:hypothetical protein
VELGLAEVGLSLGLLVRFGTLPCSDVEVHLHLSIDFIDFILSVCEFLLQASLFLLELEAGSFRVFSH